MTRLKIAMLWAEGKLTDEEVNNEMAKTEHPILRDYDPLHESDSYWDGEEENTSMAVGLELMNKYGENKTTEFMTKFWINEPIIKYDPSGNLVD